MSGCSWQRVTGGSRVLDVSSIDEAHRSPCDASDEATSPNVVGTSRKFAEQAGESGRAATSKRPLMRGSLAQHGAALAA